jgi:hypothetical protein
MGGGGEKRTGKIKEQGGGGEAEKKLKCKSLCIEIRLMWNMKCMIIPVTDGAIGILTKGLKKTLEAIPGKHSTVSLQKTAIFGTWHIIISMETTVL